MSDSRSRHCRWCILAAIVAAALSGQAQAQQADPSPDKLVALRLEWQMQQARQDVAGWELEQLPTPRPPGAAVGRFQDPGVVLTELRPILDENYKALREASRKLAENARARRDEAKKDWEDVYRQRIAFRQYTDEQQSAYGFDFDTGALPGFKPTIFDAVLVGWAVVVFLVAVRLGKRLRRVAIRKAQRMGATAALLALMLVSGCSGSAAPDGRPWAVREEAKLTADTQELTEKANATTANADKKWKAVVDGWAALVAVPNKKDPVEEILRQGENDTHERLRTAATEARLANLLADEAKAQKEELATDRTKLDELTSDAKLRTVMWTSIRCAGAVMLLGLSVWPYLRARRKEAAIIKADARKCPRCFSEKLVVEKHAPPLSLDEEEDSKSRRTSKGKPKPKPKAKALADPPTESGYIECKACGFRFLRSYQKVRRLCFPVVGVRASGKTHMLATGYDKVRKQIAPTIATLQPAVSLGDERFNQIIELILAYKKDAGGNPHVMPDPVMLEVCDADRAGPNTALLNLFDYAGELVNQKIDMDRLKKQAVKMDGFMLFLDPTQLDGDGGKVTLERQLVALSEFMSDMREARSVGVGRRIPVPVAVCITKFDLLLTENPIQGQVIPVIDHLNTELNPPPEETTLHTITERSELVKDFLPLMFRGVKIIEVIERYVGPQVMFFPISSVSLIKAELGIKNMAKRTIVPYGVAEPFLWLLHMHGYEIFA
ncbi:MAG: hypothetical protein L0241_17520 [Planctomycetia bacterium]|nr:hypothetical protein [Planctomycetia bacterium]